MKKNSLISENSRSVFVSFFTDDDYYSQSASALESDLRALNLTYVIRKVDKTTGHDWVDITRYKVRFLKEMCDLHPTQNVIWIDIDSSLLRAPEHLIYSSADITGFQRGYSNPFKIGYAHHNRFWEPSLFGIGTSVQARHFINRAYEIEQNSVEKATDDYFWESAWRELAPILTFQILPQTDRYLLNLKLNERARRPFFVFGSSGNVPLFKSIAKQHSPIFRKSRIKILKKFLLRVEKKLPNSFSNFLRRLVAKASKSKNMINLAASGNVQRFNEYLSRLPLEVSSGPKAKMSSAVLEYRTSGKGKPISLSWWTEPAPGNFGDWLSPYIISKVSTRPIKYVSPFENTKSLFAIGSIGRYVGSKSIVVGTGISQSDTKLDPNANYISVRGPLTAKVLVESGGPTISRFGDLGAAISQIYSPGLETKSDKILLVRHFTHLKAPLNLPDFIEEISVYRGDFASIEELIDKIYQHKGVLTSAMHVMAVCHSYGVPCKLISFDGYENEVHGDGIKYADYSLGLGISEIRPEILPLDLTKLNLLGILEKIHIPEMTQKRLIEDLNEAIKHLDK